MPRLKVNFLHHKQNNIALSNRCGCLSRGYGLHQGPSIIAFLA